MLLFLDLGDVFTKGIAGGQDRTWRHLRFPSAVARNLLHPSAPPADELLLGDGAAMTRPADFDARRYPRPRSYPGGAEFLRDIEGRRPRGAWFAGWLAAAYGAGRQVLGLDPSVAIVEALTHKALLIAAAGDGPVEVVFIVDGGLKARVIGTYASGLGGVIEICGRSFRGRAARTLRLEVRGHVLDAAPCATEVLRGQPGLGAPARLLVIDVGYLRTKVAIASGEQGCEQQVEREGLGVADCVRRILRDGQEQGLFEDEFAVMRALEEQQHIVVLDGRVFDVRRALAGALEGLKQEVVRLAQRTAMDDYGRCGLLCTGAAVIGGGAPLLGRAVLAELERLELGIRTTWVADDASFLLCEGARRSWRRP